MLPGAAATATAIIINIMFSSLHFIPPQFPCCARFAFASSLQLIYTFLHNLNLRPSVLGNTTLGLPHPSSETIPSCFLYYSPAIIVFSDVTCHRTSIFISVHHSYASHPYCYAIPLTRRGCAFAVLFHLCAAILSGV